MFNPTATDWDAEAQQADMLAPHTGKQYLASFSAYQKANDDWLISPELPGTAQTISFWVKTESSNYGMENYEVLYSSTDKDIKSFQRIGDVREAPQAQWTEVSVDLPEGAKYFAIRCVSNDKFMFMLDDITYIGVKNYDATPLAYNIYRDDKFVAKVDASKTSYTDIEQIPVAEHTYFVTVVYSHGECRHQGIHRGRQVRGRGQGRVQHSANRTAVCHQGQGYRQRGEYQEIVFQQAGRPTSSSHKD